MYRCTKHVVFTFFCLGGGLLFLQVSCPQRGRKPKQKTNCHKLAARASTKRRCDISVDNFVCMYIYICIYVYVYVYVYMNMYIYT